MSPGERGGPARARAGLGGRDAPAIAARRAAAIFGHNGPMSDDGGVPSEAAAPAVGDEVDEAAAGEAEFRSQLLIAPPARTTPIRSRIPG